MPWIYDLNPDDSPVYYGYRRWDMDQHESLSIDLSLPLATPYYTLVRTAWDQKMGPEI